MASALEAQRQRGRRITPEEVDALPDDGVKRWVINGFLREEGSEDDISVRNPFHAITLSRFDGELRLWLRSQQLPQGEFLAGDAGFVVCDGPYLLVCPDLAYLTHDQLVQAMPGESGRLHIAPLIAIEVLSPSDRGEDVNEKIHAYLRNSVQLVWIVEPEFRTIVAYRPDDEPTLFNRRHELTAEPHLPGFRVPVRNLFYPG